MLFSSIGVDTIESFSFAQNVLQLFSSLGTFEQKKKLTIIIVVTTQMLLNSKRLDKVVLHNECGLSVARFAFFSFAC